MSRKKKSVRRRSQDLGIARESLRTTLTDDLKLHPNTIQVKQKQKRVEMCEWITGMIEDDILDVPDLMTDIWFSDEARVHFYLSLGMSPGIPLSTGEVSLPARPCDGLSTR